MSAAQDVTQAVAAQSVVVDQVVAKHGRVVTPPPPPPPLTPPAWVVQKPICVGVNGPMKFGYNLQGWDKSTGPNNAVVTHHMGNLMRHTAWKGVAIQGYLDTAKALGIETLIILSPPQTTLAANSGWAAMVTSAVKQGKAAGVTKYSCSNEPHFGSGPYMSAEDYAGLTVITSKAALAVDPNAIVCAPVTTGNYAGMDWLKKFFDAKPVFKMFTFHPYYKQTPEENIKVDIIPLMNYVRSRGWNRFGMSESGYSNTPGKAGTNEDDMRQTTGQQIEKYPRMVFLHRGCGAEFSEYYMLRDHGVNPSDFQNNFGILTSTYADKPQTQSVRDSFAHVIPAIGGADYNPNGGNTWLTRCDYPGNAQHLAVWNPTGASVERVWCVAQAATTLRVQMMGGATTTQALVAGPQLVSINIGARIVVLQGQGVTYPEYT